MKIRSKLHILTFLLFFSILSITGLSLGNWNRLQKLNQTVFLGQDLLNQTQKVMGLMKDIVFDLFAPQMYSQIRSLTYSPRSVATYKTWLAAVDDYQKTFLEFVDGREQNILQDDELQDIYDTSLTLNQRALDKLNNMSVILIVLQEMDLEGENLYITMQQDEALIPFFVEFRDTSYYFTNTFESYMNHFFSSFRQKSLELERELYFLFLIVSILMGTLSVLYSHILAKEIMSKILQVNNAFARIALGDFSETYTNTDQDELSSLLDSINSLSHDLKANIDGILNLTRDMGTSFIEGSSRDEVVYLVAETIINDTSAEGAAVYLYDQLAHEMVLQSQKGDVVALKRNISLKDPIIGSLKKGKSRIYSQEDSEAISSILNETKGISLMIIPLMRKDVLEGFIAAMIFSSNRIFSDLGVIRLNNFAEYVSLALDNHTKYREVLEKREAEYNALQSQVQPHFIYNVLNGFIGLNRQGEQKLLEKAIFSLREMLRYVTVQERWTTLKEEITFLNTYCELQKIRFGNRLTYIFEIPEELEKFPLPKLLLQPLVENAIVHGLEPLEEGGTLSIRGKIFYKGEQKRMVLTLDDTGVGFNPEGNDSGDHIGLKNVTERLKMAYPGSEILVHSSPGEGTSVLITIISTEKDNP